MIGVPVDLLSRTRMFSFSNSKSVNPCWLTNAAKAWSSSILNDGSLICLSFFSATLFSSFAFAEAVLLPIISSLRVEPLFRSGYLARIVDQFDHRHLGIVALPAAEFDDACVAAITIFV